MTAIQTNLMQCAAYGLSTDRLTPHPFNLCSSAGSTHSSISQTQPLDMTRSTCTQLLWSTMARPVLSGTCPVKLLYGLGHYAAAQFQGLGNLLIAYAHLFVEQHFFFQILRELFAMRCHVEPPVTSTVILSGVLNHSGCSQVHSFNPTMHCKNECTTARESPWCSLRVACAEWISASCQKIAPAAESSIHLIYKRSSTA